MVHHRRLASGVHPGVRDSFCLCGVSMQSDLFSFSHSKDNSWSLANTTDQSDSVCHMQQHELGPNTSKNKFKINKYNFIWRPQVFDSSLPVNVLLECDNKKMGVRNKFHWVCADSGGGGYPSILTDAQWNDFDRTSGSHNSFHLGEMIQSYNIHQLECWGEGMIHIEGYEAITQLDVYWKLCLKMHFIDL